MDQRDHYEGVAQAELFSMPTAQVGRDGRVAKRRGRLQYRRPWIAVFLVCLVIAAGCTPARQNVPQLTVLSLVVSLLREGDATTAARSLQIDDTVPIAAGDKIIVGEQGRARIELEDLGVELFHDAEVDVKDVKARSGSDVLLHLRQNAGHVRASLAEQAQDRLVIETTYAEIRPSPGAVVSVCHADGILTCVVNEQGTTEVRAQNQTVTLRAGEASYVLERQPPHLPICTNSDQYRIWLDQMKDSREDQVLGEVVANWDEHGCNNVQPPSSSGAPPASTSTPAALESAQASGAVAPPADGMVQIPAGKYEVGVGKPDKNHAPAQTVDLPAFWIDIAETTNAQYAQYLAEPGHSPPSTWPGGVLPAGKDEHPVEGLTFDDAQAFCQWAGKRLPKEVEWEVATRGPGADPPLYPWGIDPTAGGATFDLPQVDSYPVATVPFNVSKFGVNDTIGNVWEWTSTPYAETASGMQVLRGGRHGQLADGAFRQQSAPDDPRFRAVAGVRCAADVAKENTP